MGLVSGKVALVTDARAGIVRAVALKFFDEGAKVVVSDLNGDGGNETAALIRQKGGDAVFIRKCRRCCRRNQAGQNWPLATRASTSAAFVIAGHL
jgi:NAD(P)-dependent dehydrogenase (short-subunit alcohol dehydrogenase family)